MLILLSSLLHTKYVSLEKWSWLLQGARKKVSRSDVIWKLCKPGTCFSSPVPSCVNFLIAERRKKSPWHLKAGFHACIGAIHKAWVQFLCLFWPAPLKDCKMISFVLTMHCNTFTINDHNSPSTNGDGLTYCMAPYEVWTYPSLLKAFTRSQ